MQKNQIHIDYELLMKLRDGNEKAFSVVFETYHRYLYVLACRYLMSDNYAEDAVQYTFMRLWEGRTTFDYRTGIKNLLFTILKNYILNEIRHNNLVIQKNYELAQFTEEMETDFLHELEDADFRSHLYRLIDQLAPQKKEVCLLKIQQGMSNQEVADAMNISISTVKSHYTQVIKFLRSQMDKIMIVVLAIRSFL
ncbi:MAG: RNA polymerase sigma-70 factor [Bacteroidales bacterium]|nr:RNA polymerase sigma-70 factor [Bacteroidales bacterium]MDD3908248.1 RNA polymerase sigma-70 factor [Bacteroidales bacterium]MDD4712423.1 RNA polymerase sigma-70 factor [Bacteroidales bacterium]